MATSKALHLVEVIFASRGDKETAAKIRNLAKELEIYQKKEQKAFKQSAKGKKEAQKQTQAATDATKKGVQAQNDFVRAAKRALIVAPTWMLIRGAMQLVLSSIKDIIKVYKELDEGMRRVMAVATFTGETQAKVYADLELAARNYFATSAAGMKDITEAMYQLGTAGLDTEQIMVGFEHVMNLAIATFGDVKPAGRLMAGIFNVFGEELKEVGDTAEQMQYVSDLLTTAWKNNQIELSELNTSLGHLASAGKISGLGLEELAASAAVMSDALLRGGKGGRLLAASFVKIADNRKKLQDIGVYFDPSKPLDFYDVMNQLHTIFVENGRDLEFLDKLVDIFGRRGVKAVGSHLELWEKFNEEISRTRENIDGNAKAMKESAEETVSAIFARAWHNIITSRDIAPGKSAFKEVLKDIFQFEEAEKSVNKIKIITEALNKYGKELKLTEVQVKSLSEELGVLGAPNLAKKLREVFGVSTLSAMLASTNELKAGADAYDVLIKKIEELKIAEEELIKTKQERKAGKISLEPEEDRETRAIKEGLKYRLLGAKSTSKTAIIIEKITDLLRDGNKLAAKQGKELLTVGDILNLNKDKIKTITADYKELLKLGVQAIVSGEKDRLSISKLLIQDQLNQLKTQGATLEQQVRARQLFEKNIIDQNDIVSKTERELELRRAINATKETDLRLSSQTLKLADIAAEHGVDVARELGELFQERIKFAQFEQTASEEAQRLLAEIFPQIQKTQKALQFFREEGEFAGGRGREIPISEEGLRSTESLNLMNAKLERQITLRHQALAKQLELVKLQQENNKNLIDQTAKLEKAINDISLEKEPVKVEIKFKDTEFFQALGKEIDKDGSSVANSVDTRIEKK
jgi:TP901 family phage tail tape measure protein